METTSVDSVNFTRNITTTLQYSLKNWDLFTDNDRKIFMFVNHVTLSTLFCLFGIVGNVINICVFVKQGLTKSMNSSFFATSISDLLEIIFQIWHNICLNPYLLETDSNIDFNAMQYLTAGTPSVLLVRITGWITVYITAERCLSIAVPLKIKQLVTPKRTVAILVFIYVMNFAGLVPLYFSAYFSWNFNSAQNRTKLGISFRTNRKETVSLISSFHSSMTIIAFSLVVIFTSILVITLKRKSKWRRKSTTQTNQMETISTRERKTIFMVILIATILIACYSPGISFSIVTSINQDFSISGKYTNLFQAAWSFAFLLHSVNSSITILLYYKTSTKYRETFHELFQSCLNACGSLEQKKATTRSLCVEQNVA